MSGQAQARGLASIRALKANLQQSASEIRAGSDYQHSTTPCSEREPSQTPQPHTEAEIAAEVAFADEKDRIAVAEEFQRYLEEGVLENLELNDLNLPQYWQVSHCDLLSFALVQCCLE